MTRHQKGHIFKRGGSWYVRFYDSVVQEDGSIKRVQVARTRLENQPFAWG
jgi:hypothetical protein